MLNSDLDIRQRLVVARLPAMPHILLKLLELCHGGIVQDEEGSSNVWLDDFADLIVKDAAITMKILGAASRSTHLHLNQKPGLRQALQTLGIDTVKALLIGESVTQVFDSFTNSGSSDLRGFWRHSYTAALAAQKIAVMADYPHLEEAYLAGLLHDVGRLALLSAAPQEYATLLSHVDDSGLCVAEKQTFDLTHPEAGAWLLSQFSLDSFLADSVLYHHQPVEQVVAAHPLIRTALLADLIASHGASEPALAAAQLLFGLDAEALLTICNDTEAHVKETAAFLKIDLAGTEQAMAVPYPSKRASSDNNARELLMQEVQQVILAAEVRRSFSGESSERNVISAVVKSAQMQFGFENVLFLLRDFADDPSLRGVALESSKQSFSEFSIPLRGGGLISESVTQRQIVFLEAKSPALTLAEEQLFRLLEAEHLVCLPLFAGQHEQGHHEQVGQQGLGVIIASLPGYRLAELRARSSSLRIFASQTAITIDAVRIKAVESMRITEKYRQAARWVVHEASNPLSIIKNYLAVLDAKITRKESVQAEVAILSQEIDRVSQILRGLADTQIDMTDAQMAASAQKKSSLPGKLSSGKSSSGKSSSGKSSVEMLGINQVVADVVRFLQVTGFVPSAINLEVRLQSEIIEIKVDSNALKQILINLIKNAVEAIQQAGEIIVSISGYINRDGRLYCALIVHDDGPGIAPPVMAKLFSPVHSAKSGDHAGLGLSIVHGLVQSMDGIIMCRSDGSGTTFELLLPVDDAKIIDAGMVGEVEVENISQSRKYIGDSYGRN